MPNPVRKEEAMSDYTPSELELITAWVDQRRNILEYDGNKTEPIVQRTEQAQRTINRIRAEAFTEGYKKALHAHGIPDRNQINNPYKE